MTRTWTMILVAVVTALLLAYALWDVDIAVLGDQLAGASYGYAVPFLVALTLFYFFKAWRWAGILAPLGRYSVAQVTPAMMIGFAGNNVLPAHLGEIIRSVLFARRYAQPVSAVLVSQVLERILDVVAILLLYLMAVPWIASPPDAIRVSVWIAAAATILAAVLIGALLASPESVFKLWQLLSRKLPSPLQRHGQSFLQNVLQALSSVQSPLRLLWLIGNSLAQWALMALAVWVSLRAFEVTVGPAVTIIVLTATVIAVTLPSAPGYIGALQAAFVFALQPFDVGNETAFAASVFFLVCQWVPVTAVGALFLFKSGLRVSEVRNAARHGDPSL